MPKPLAIIIEDDPHLGSVYSLTMQNEFEIELIPDGAEALSRLECVNPAIIILDLHLPGVTGAQIAAWVCSVERLNHTHLILCTADAQQADYLDHYADIVLLKPVSPTQLRTLALRLLDKSSVDRRPPD